MDTNNKSNEKLGQKSWRDRIDEIYNSFSLIVNDEKRPGSRREIVNARNVIDELKGENKGDAQFEQEIEKLEGILNESSKRKFNGSKLTIAGVLIGILVMFCMTIRIENKSGKLLIDDAERKQKHKITQLERSIKNTKNMLQENEKISKALEKELTELNSQEQTNQIRERIEQRQISKATFQKAIENRKKSIQQSEKEHKKLSSMSAEEYRDYKVAKGKEASDSISGYSWRTLFWFILFVVSGFTPVYTINKRSTKNKIVKHGWLLRLVGRVMDSGYTIRYRRSDGTTYTDQSGHLMAFAGGLAFLLVSIIVIVVLLPYFAVFAFIRNFVIPYFY